MESRATFSILLLFLFLWLPRLLEDHAVFVGFRLDGGFLHRRDLTFVRFVCLIKPFSLKGVSLASSAHAWIDGAHIRIGGALSSEESH